MNKPFSFSLEKIFERMSVGVIAALIYFTCGDPVAEHFLYIVKRHFLRE